MTATPLDSRKQEAHRRLYGLDAIRGLAIFLVLLRHSWPDTFGGAGIVGVVMFFALSGYLITSLLVKDIMQNGRINYRRFYQHRAFRLLPALILMLTGFALIEGIWNIRGERTTIPWSLVVGMTYIINVPGVDGVSGAISHLWTLAAEEQFYLIWPVALVVAIRLRKPSLITVGIIGLIICLCALSMVVASPEYSKVYTLPTSWFACMLLGALAYLEKDRLFRILPTAGLLRISLPVAALATLLAISISPLSKDWAGTYLLIGPIIAICTIIIVVECTRWSSGPAPALLLPLVWLGMISYAAYLWNYPIAAWTGGRPLSLQAGLVVIALTLTAATVSWFLVERPCANLRKRIDHRRAPKDNAGVLTLDSTPDQQTTL